MAEQESLQCKSEEFVRQMADRMNQKIGKKALKKVAQKVSQAISSAKHLLLVVARIRNPATDPINGESAGLS